MSLVRLSVVTVAAALGTLGIVSGANAQSNCDWYAKTALKQQQENEQLGCGLKGPEWSWDLSAHINWCRNVSPDLWKKQAQLREQKLESCSKK